MKDYYNSTSAKSLHRYAGNAPLKILRDKRCISI